MVHRCANFWAFVWILSVGVVLSTGAVDSTEINRVPKLGGWVNDTASVLTETDRDRLSEMLSAYHRETHHQIALLTIPSLGAETIEAFSLRTAKEWRLGYKGVDNGILITLAMKERKARIEVGTGMERYISDSEAKAILDTDMTPAFSKGDFYGGLHSGLLRLMDKGRRFVVPAESISSQVK